MSLCSLFAIFQSNSSSKFKETHSKLVFAKNQNIRKKNRISKNHSKVIMASLHFNNSNYRENLAVGTWKFVRIIEVFELQRFELRKVNYKSFLRNFHGDFKFIRIMEILKLRGFELERVNCIVRKCRFLYELIFVTTADYRFFVENSRFLYSIHDSTSINIFIHYI